MIDHAYLERGNVTSGFWGQLLRFLVDRLSKGLRWQLRLGGRRLER